jgi:manganese/zinc/iron transport system substrate-binding protein
VPPVVQALSDAAPEHAEGFKERGDRYIAEMEALHAWAQQRVAELPEEKRILVTSHDAFNYLGRAYGFQVIGVQGISTVTEAGLADVAKVVDFIRENGVKAIFVESSVPRATIERISQDSGAIVGGELFSDAMGTPGEIEEVAGERYDLGTYTGMLKHNINTAVQALK